MRLGPQLLKTGKQRDKCKLSPHVCSGPATPAQQLQSCDDFEFQLCSFFMSENIFPTWQDSFPFSILTLYNSEPKAFMTNDLRLKTSKISHNKNCNASEKEPNSTIYVT